MYFVRTFKTGCGDYDPRQKKWAVYKCSICGKETEIDITYNGTFDYSCDRRCPHCKSLGKDDRLNNIKAEIETLTEKKSEIQIKIDKLCREADELSNGVLKDEVDH